ncbi:PEGA domain-containing protein [Candidatus Dojkabacteria bacterium]|uniref:PEGA domain-containing protein n=1 Tax=Candidatus Dojkabacteria bacterium TaxID=2099670 RepID=A0A955IDA7_9BACT|nr:PEGA domain-containing protein [Candidatus Dojkabacteria bacterium]
MSRFTRLTILLLVGFLCALWSPWNSWNLSLPVLLGMEPAPEIGGLQVTSLAGDVVIYIDGFEMGQVASGESITISPIDPGERQIRLKRVSDVDNAYWEFNRLVKFESGIDVVIAYELGPTEEFSEGHVIYATKSPAVINGIKLNLDATVEGATVLLDGNEIGSTPLVSEVLSLDSQHTLKITKSGYEEQEFKLLPEDQADRDKVAGFNLNVTVNLFLQPLPTK